VVSPTTVTYSGGPTAILDYAGLRFVTDPTFDPPRSYAEPGSTTLVKTAGPGVPREQLGRVDAVLLSHHSHKDNLDYEGLELLATGVPTFSTQDAATELFGGGLIGLDSWESAEIGPVTITAVPALHGPPGSERFVGVVTGFVLEAEGEPTVYVSGDNASLPLVEQIAGRFPEIGLAVLFAGAARTPLVEGELTLSARDAATAAGILGAERVVVLHAEDWQHFSEPHESVAAAFDGVPAFVGTPRGVPVTL
jgi:L-ascorbate metabolism protein UlaG (beta-lactamase superfamily)